MHKIKFDLNNNNTLRYSINRKNHEINLNEYWGKFRAGEIIKTCAEPEGGYYNYEDDPPLLRLKETGLFKAGKSHKMVSLISGESRRELEKLLEKAGY